MSVRESAAAACPIASTTLEVQGMLGLPSAHTPSKELNRGALLPHRVSQK